MPVRNGERYLRAALTSIAHQTLRNIEVIIVDDGSEDATPSILAQAESDDPRIIVMTLQTSGISAALEAGRSVARAPYIARMDCDDLAMPHRLAAQAQFLDRHPDVIAVGGQVQIIDESGRTLRRGRFPVHSAACRSYLTFGAPFCHPTVMIRREALQRVGGYRSYFEPGEDFDLWLRLSKLGDLANLEDVVLHYRVHTANVTRRRAIANAISASLALVAHHYGESVLPSSARAKRAADANWSAIEELLPYGVRLIARAAYLRALVLNGGITEPAEFSLFARSIPEFSQNQDFASKKELLAFMVVRCAYQAARSAAPTMAVCCISLGLRHNLTAFVREFMGSLTAMLQGQHLSRAGLGHELPTAQSGAAQSSRTE